MLKYFLAFLVLLQLAWLVLAHPIRSKNQQEKENESAGNYGSSGNYEAAGLVDPEEMKHDDKWWHQGASSYMSPGNNMMDSILERYNITQVVLEDEKDI